MTALFPVMDRKGRRGDPRSSSAAMLELFLISSELHTARFYFLFFIKPEAPLQVLNNRSGS